MDESLILKPPVSMLEKYYELVDSNYARILNSTLENKELVKLRDWLLPMLMNGQVTVK